MLRRIPAAQQFRHCVNAVICADLDIVQQLLTGPIIKLWHIEVPHPDLQRADRFQQALLHGASDAHDLAGGLHLGAQGVVGVSKLVKGETGHLCHHIVQRGFKGCGGICNGNLVQGHSNGDLRADSGNGIAAGLAGQGGGTGHAGVDLNEVILKTVRVKGKLHVAAALDFQRPNDLQGTVPEHMILLVGQGLGGADHDAVAGMNAHRINIFHVADGDGGIVGIPHDLVFDLLKALDGFFHQHLMDRRKNQRVFHDFTKFRLVIGKAAACSAQREGGAQHHGITDLRGNFQTFLDGIGNIGRQHRLTQRLAELLELLPILCLSDTGAFRSKQFRAALPQNAFMLQLHGKVQACLSANAGQYGVWTLIPYDFCDVFQSQRLHIHLICDRGVGHDGGRVGVAQHHLIALLLQSQTSLCTGIVKLCRLTNNDGTGTDHQHLFDVRSLRHGFVPPPSASQNGQTDRRCPGDRARSPGGTAR